MNPEIDKYFADGCGRCPLGSTPECKVHNWPKELRELRRIVLECGLTEELKWSVPCYTYKGKNVLIVSAFKDYSSISFFKGALLRDPKQLLEKPGPNSKAARHLKFSESGTILELEGEIKACIFEAIEVEKAGLAVTFRKNPEPLPAELENRLEQDPVLKSAFKALTPGRQRGYVLHFSAPKQSKTRESRIDQCVSKILNGEGLHDNYAKMKDA